MSNIEDLINALTENFIYEDVVRAEEYSKGYVEGFKDGLEADRPQGEWIDIGGYEVCKNCHEVKRFPHWNFCPNCGARMKGVDDE